MLRKTKTQNSLNLFSMPPEPEKIAERSTSRDDAPVTGSVITTGKQNLSESFFGLDTLAQSIDIAQKISKAQENERRSSKQHLAELSEQQKSRKLTGFNPMTSNGSSILSANAGGISDMGGPQKQLKTPISNSIFEPGRNAKEADKIDSKTATRIEKEQIATNKRSAEKQRMDDLVEALRTTNQDKASSVHRTGTGNTESTDFKPSRNNMSIFDSGDFERIPEKTAGEKVSEEVAEKRSQIDESWRQNGKSLKSSEVTNRFFDNLINNLETNGR